MKLSGLLAGAIGLGLFAFIVSQAGLGSVLSASAAIGWQGFCFIVVCQAAIVGVTGLAWWLVGIGRVRAGPGAFVFARFVRDAACQVLPFTSIGGIALGGRALALEGASAPEAARATVLDLTLEFSSQLVYAAIGLLFLQAHRPGNFPTRPVLAIVLGLPVMAFGLALANKFGARLGKRLLARIASGGASAALKPSTVRWPAALAALVHLSGWIFSGAVTWAILILLQAHIALGGAIAIDSLTCAAKAIAFMIPSGIGVQEGGFVLFAGLFGVSPSTALALSLIRRGRDLTIALPTIGLWQLRHGARIWTVTRPPDEAAKEARENSDTP